MSLIAIFWAPLVLLSSAFLTPSRLPLPRLPSTRIRNGKGNIYDGSNGNLPPTHGDGGWSWSSASEDPQPLLIASWKPENMTERFDCVRGGGSNAENVVKGAQATLSSTSSFWGRNFQSLSSTVTKPFKSAGRKVSSLFQSKEKKLEAELMEQLQTMPVRHVSVNSTVLPTDVVQLAARRTGILGSPLRMDKVQDLAQTLKRWYSRKGYILHSVTGATLKPETATAEISVQEPVTSRAPVGITFCKEMVVDEGTGDLLTFRQYKDKNEKRRTFGFDKVKREDLNTTFVQTSGRTNPHRLASALGLKPGKPFRWNGQAWRQIASSGIFARVLRATPKPMGDGSVQLHIMATEAPARHLEYGLGRSLYTGSWEGELDFEHANLLGGGETIGLTVRRGTKDAFPSVRVSFSDSKFGMAGGYDVQAFSDFLGGKNVKDSKRAKSEEAESAEDVKTQEVESATDSVDPMRARRGLLLRIRNPITQRIMTNSVASASLERTTTEAGLHENIASTTFNVGPFLRRLPFDARSNFDVALTAGTRVAQKEKTSEESDSFLAGKTFLPYTTVTATTKQIFPLIYMQSADSTRRPVDLALRHSVTASTSDIPRHEAKAQGLAANIRGSPSNGMVTSSLRGTTELRIPVNVPIIKNMRQDGNIVVFGDWLVGAEESSLFRKSSLGLGLRKSIQGLPIQFDVTYSKELKLKTSFGLGRDFDV